MFGPANPVSQLINDVIAFLPRILVAIVLIIVAAAIAKVVRDMVTSALVSRPAGRALASRAGGRYLPAATLAQVGTGLAAVLA